MSIQEENRALLARLSAYLTADARAITPALVAEMSASTGLTNEEAYLPLLAAFMNLAPEIARRYLPRMVRLMSPAAVEDDLWFRALADLTVKEHDISLEQDTYAPCELFVANDFVMDEQGRVYPQLGWFAREVTYPALKEHGRVWMTVTPNEINTIRPFAQAVHGRVLAYGLGLGYFVCHALLNPAVESVTVVERNPAVIRLFRQYLASLLPRPDRLSIVQADAFDYARHTAPQQAYDCVFTDLWHDVGDGLPLYRQMKAIETPGPRYFYWLEKTLRCYLPDAEAASQP